MDLGSKGLRIVSRTQGQDTKERHHYRSTSYVRFYEQATVKVLDVLDTVRSYPES